MRDVMTQAEKTLATNDHEDAVTGMRHLFQKTMKADYTEAVERLTGQKVMAFISGNNAEPDIASELFILDSPIEPPASAPHDRSAVDGHKA